MSLTFDSSRFGRLEVDADAVIEFPAGLIGLGGSRYALVATEPDAPFAWLHSVDDPDVALPVTNPWLHYGDYQVELSDADTERVGAEDPAADRRLGHRSRRVRARRTSVATSARRLWSGRAVGHQVINEAPDAPVRAPLFPEAAAVQAA